MTYLLLVSCGSSATTTTARGCAIRSPGLVSQGPSSHLLFEKYTLCESTVVAGSSPTRPHGGARCGRPWIILCYIWPRTWLLLLAISVPLHERLHPRLQSRCCTTSPLPAPGHDSEAPTPGCRDGVVAQKHTPSATSPVWVCGSCLPGMLAFGWGCIDAVTTGPACTTSHSRPSVLCSGDMSNCVQCRSCCKAFSELAEHVPTMRCSSNLPIAI